MTLKKKRGHNSLAKLALLRISHRSISEMAKQSEAPHVIQPIANSSGKAQTYFFRRFEIALAFDWLEPQLEEGDVYRTDLKFEFENDRSLTMPQLYAVYQSIEKKGGVEYPHEKNVRWDCNEIELSRMEFRVVQLLLQVGDHISSEINIPMSDEEEIEARKKITGLEGWHRGNHEG